MTRSYPKRFRCSKKQTEIMRHIIDAVSRGEEITMLDVMAKLSYTPPTRSAMQCSIRYLEHHGFLVKTMRGNKSMYLSPTEAGMVRFRSRLP